MNTQIGSRKSTYTVIKNIPRIPVDAKGRQGRAATGSITITPGMAEAMEFVWGDMDGLPISFVGAKVVLVFWTNQYDKETHELEDNRLSDVVVLKRISPDDPYASTTTFTLTPGDTFKIGQAATNGTGVSWGIYLETTDGNWPAAVKTDGSRAGSVIIDRMNNIPIPEILNSTP
jgi:hypothetical protein